MSVSITKDGDRIVVRIPDQLGRHNRMQLKRKVDEEVQRGARNVVLDFSHTSYIDNSGLRTLLLLSLETGERGGEFGITGVSGDLRTLFALAKFETLLSLGEWDDGLAGQPARLTPKQPGPLADAAAEPGPDIPP